MTTEERLEKLERELARVRRHNRRLSLAGAVLLLLVGAVVLTGATTPKSTDYSTSDFKFRSVQAQDFSVMDENGNPRAALHVFKDKPELYLLDENGEIRFMLNVDKERSWLSLADEKGMTGIILVVTKNGSGLSLWDENAPRAALTGFKDKPELELYDENNEVVWSAPPRH